MTTKSNLLPDDTYRFVLAGDKFEIWTNPGKDVKVLIQTHCKGWIKAHPLTNDVVAEEYESEINSAWEMQFTSPIADNQQLTPTPAR